MQNTLISIAFGAASFFVVRFMMQEIVRRSSEPASGIVPPAQYNKGMQMAIYLGAAIVSIVCGYAISACAVTPAAVIELSACYFAALAAAVIDARLQIIPNYLSIMLIIVRLAVMAYEVIITKNAAGFLISSVVGCLLIALFLILSNRIAKGGVGGGDIKLLSCIGFTGGISTVLYTFLYALIACCIVSVLMLLTRKYTVKDQIPFGPFIYLGFSAMCIITFLSI